MARFDKTVQSLKEMGDAMLKIKQASAIPSGGENSQLQATNLNPMDVAQALAESLKSDNATTQAIAVRIANLSEKYPNKAY